MTAQTVTLKQNAIPATMFSVKLNEAMRDRDLSIRDIAEQTGGSYENIRRIVNGTSIPSEFLLRGICDAVGLDRAGMSQIAKADKIRIKYGTVPLELSGKKPGMELLDRVWDDLTPDQQRGITSMAQGWAKQNRAQKAG